PALARVRARFPASDIHGKDAGPGGRPFSMRYLVTGGAGFIGSHLAEELLRRGDEVFVVDDLSTGTIENIRHLKGESRFHYVVDSCANVPLMAEMVDSCD